LRYCLGIFVGLSLLAGCSKPPPTPERRAEIDQWYKGRLAQQLIKAKENNKRLEVPIAECVNFLETGSFEPEKLINAGLESYTHTFRSGTGYRIPKSENLIFEINMIEAGEPEQIPRCTINMSGGSIVSILKDMGFDLDASKRKALFSRDGLDLNLTGSYNVTGTYRSRSGPVYYALKPVKI